MALKKNTISIRFINITRKKDNNGYFFNFRNPLGSKSYIFYVSPETRKQLDIGSTVFVRDKNIYGIGLAVVVDNQTEYNAKKKRQTIIKPTGRHIRSYITEKFNNNGFAITVYRRFKKVAYKARRQVAIEQKKYDPKTSKQVKHD